MSPDETAPGMLGNPLLSISGMSGHWPPLGTSHSSCWPCTLTCISHREEEVCAFSVDGHVSTYLAMDIIQQLQARKNHRHVVCRLAAIRSRLECRLAAIQSRMECRLAAIRSHVECRLQLPGPVWNVDRHLSGPGTIGGLDSESVTMLSTLGIWRISVVNPATKDIAVHPSTLPKV